MRLRLNFYCLCIRDPKAQVSDFKCHTVRKQHIFSKNELKTKLKLRHKSQKSDLWARKADFAGWIILIQRVAAPLVENSSDKGLPLSFRSTIYLDVFGWHSRHFSAAAVLNAVDCAHHWENSQKMLYDSMEWVEQTSKVQFFLMFLNSWLADKTISFLVDDSICAAEEKQVAHRTSSVGTTGIWWLHTQMPSRSPKAWRNWPSLKLPVILPERSRMTCSIWSTPWRTMFMNWGCRCLYQCEKKLGLKGAARAFKTSKKAWYFGGTSTEKGYTPKTSQFNDTKTW